MLYGMIGTKVLEERESPINGKIRVIKDLAWGVHIQAEGLTQSGGVVETIWKSTLKKIHSSYPVIHNSLILGLGGGTAAKLVRKYYPEAEIVGVDIDPVMVEMGKKYMELDKSKVEIKIQDASKFLTTYYKLHATKFDLILVDLYIGHEVPEKFKSDKFLGLILRLLTNGGVAVFNRLYFGEKRAEAVKFGQKLEKIFPRVEYFYPEANVMFICRDY